MTVETRGQGSLQGSRRGVLLRAVGAAPAAALVAGVAGCTAPDVAPGDGAGRTAPEVTLRYLAWLKEWGDVLPRLAPRLREAHRVVLDVELAAVGVTPWTEKLQTLFA